MKLEVALRFTPTTEIIVGTLTHVAREIAFEFAPSFIGTPLPIAPFRLPARAGIQFYDRSHGGELFGLFEDSLPDGWGRRLLDVAFQKQCARFPTPLERLACVGLRGMGALVYRPVMEIDASPEATFDLATLATDAMNFDAGKAEDVLPEVRRAGGSSGGARPKINVGFNPSTEAICPDAEILGDGFEHWLIKFPNQQDGPQAGINEWRYAQMAIAAGVEMSDCKLIETAAGTFFATRRFDRTPDGKRYHFASAAGLLDVDYRIPGNEYRLLFRLTDILTHDYEAKKELFRRAALNVLAHNRDDHLKNFGFLMDTDGTWRLAPFYDFTYSMGPNGWQTLSVAGEGQNPSATDLLRLANDVNLASQDAKDILQRVTEAIAEATN